MNQAICNQRERRRLAAAFALCGLATLTLLAAHPRARAGSFAELLRYEADHRLIDGLVHGGFIVTLSALMVCFVLLARVLGSWGVPVISALVAFLVGAAALMASMIVDGFATPAIAARFAADLPTAKTLFILLGTLVRFLMPMGLLFQSAAMLGWSWTIVRNRGLGLAVGVFGLATALSTTVALFALPAILLNHVLLAAIVLQGIWYLGLAVVLLRSA